MKLLTVYSTPSNVNLSVLTPFASWLSPSYVASVLFASSVIDQFEQIARRNGRVFPGELVFVFED